MEMSTEVLKARKDLIENGIDWYIESLRKEYGVLVNRLGHTLCLVKNHLGLSYYTYDVNVVLLYNKLSEQKERESK